MADNKITTTMDAIHEKIVEQKKIKNKDFAQELQRLAVRGLRGGMDSEAWRRYMANLASNPEQLSRLTGEDENFNAGAYGIKILAYLIADSTCGTRTDSHIGRYLDQQMRDELDAGLPSDVRPIPEFGHIQDGVQTFLSIA
jgi:hypothetical protein